MVQNLDGELVESQIQADIEAGLSSTQETEEEVAAREAEEEATEEKTAAEKLVADGEIDLKTFDELIGKLDASQLREKLLSNPNTRPVLQSWVDRNARAATEKAVAGEEERLKSKLQQEGIERQIAAMTPEDLANQLTTNPQFRDTYTNILANRREQNDQEFTNNLNKESQIHSNTTIFGRYNEFIQKSPMSNEVKTQVVPQNYTNEEDPMGAYINAVINVWSEHLAQGIYQTQLKKNLDAATQEALAKNGGPPDMPVGRAKRGGLDVMQTSSEDLITAGLTEPEKKGK